MGNARESCGTLEQAYARSPEDWRIHHLYGLNYVVLDIKEGAEVSFTNALRLNPKNPELWYLLARLYYTDNRPQESLTASMEALKLAPQYSDVYTNVALCHEALAQDSEAIAAFQRAIELNRQLGKSRRMAVIELRGLPDQTGPLEEAAPLLKDALGLNAKSSKGHYLMGRALAKSGDVRTREGTWKRLCIWTQVTPQHTSNLACFCSV
jgi:tetratricopeptide (TPR) repeat protein